MKKNILTEEEASFHEKFIEQARKNKQKYKAAKEQFDKYVAKLDEAEKAGLISKKGQPSHLQKEWLTFRAAELLGLVKYKLLEGGEIQLVIYPHEAAKLLKKTIRSAQNALKKIREKNNKAPRMPVLLKEFCEYYGWDVEDVKKALTE